ncbi:hypothetical protein JXA88_18905 [Candidatus Fermentibacteria bacterium]|nr:hypothetical protein [Candidatus Fermentibacteria bacterium]
MTRTAARILLVAAALAPAGYLVRMVTTYWVNVPNMDQWGISQVFLWHHDDTLSFGKLLTQHNESRKVFPRLIFLGLGLLSGWDVRWEMALSMAVVGLVSLNLLLLLRKQRSLGLGWRLGIWAVLNIVLFSPVQWNNWLWGIQLVVFIPPLMLTAGLLITSSALPAWRKAILVSLLSFIATFSYANGMLLWILLLPLDLVGIRRQQAPRFHLGHLWMARAWYALTWASTMILYFHDYHRPPGKPSMRLVLERPLDALHYFLAWHGSVVVPKGTTFTADVRAACGVVVLGLFIACVAIARRRKAVGASYPWIVLGLYSVVSGVITTIGRMGLGIHQAADSRYTSFSLYVLVAIGGMLPLVVGALPRRSGRSLVGVAGCVAGGALLAFLHIRAVDASRRAIENFTVGLLEGRLALALHTVYPDTGRLVLLHPNASFVLRRYGQLRTMGLLDVDAPTPTLRWKDRQRLDQGDPAWGCFDRCALVSHDQLRFWGWVRNPLRHAPGSNVVLVATNWRGVSRPFAIRQVGLPRPDVAELLGEPDLRQCGFSGQADVRSLNVGPVEISAWTVDMCSGETHQIGGTHVVVRQ